MGEQVVELRMVPPADQFAGQPIGARIDQRDAGQIEKVLQILPCRIERRIDQIEVKRPRQKATTAEARAARMLGERKVVGAFVTGGSQ